MSSDPVDSPPRPRQRQLLAAVVLSTACGLVFGGASAWVLYQRLGPAVERIAVPAPVQGTSPGPGGQPPTYASIAAAAQPSIVRIVTRPVTAADLAAGGGGLAVGFLATADGMVVTSAHALQGATRLQLAFADGKVVDASVAGADPVHGIAVLRAAAPPQDPAVQPLSFADFQSSSLRAGDLVIAVGASAPGGTSVTAGTVSAVGRSFAVTAGTASGPCSSVLGLIAVDAAYDPQEDGAPLLDGTGRVVGVVTALATTPSPGGMLGADGRSAAELVDALGHGRGERAPSFGVETTAIDAATAAAVHGGAGALVLCVTAGGPAASAGLVPGDVITAVDSTTIDAAHPLDAVAIGLSSGQHVVLTVIRAGQERQVPIVVG